jgi:hypothetical protein
MIVVCASHAEGNMGQQSDGVGCGFNSATPAFVSRQDLSQHPGLSTWLGLTTFTVTAACPTTDPSHGNGVAGMQERLNTGFEGELKYGRVWYAVV